MNKKHDQAAALAGILQAKRGKETLAIAADALALRPEADMSAPPSPAPPAKSETPAPKRRGGKSSDPNYSQYSVYLHKSVRKKVGRALDDADAGQDFSELVEDLLEKWLTSLM